MVTVFMLLCRCGFNDANIKNITYVQRKTTTALTLLPDFIIEEYVNADLIAGALSPFKPETVAIQAGRLMLRRIDDLKKQKRNFAFETTLASKSFLKLLNECKEDGYKTNLIFLWLDSQNLAMQRVGFRVQNGGHDIPQEVIKRRYQRGLYNLLIFIYRR